MANLLLSEPQRRMLMTLADVYPNGVAWTSDLGSARTWDSLSRRGFISSMRITVSGFDALGLEPPFETIPAPGEKRTITVRRIKKPAADPASPSSPDPSD